MRAKSGPKGPWKQTTETVKLILTCGTTQYPIEEKIRCPNDDNPDQMHHIIKNGKDGHHKDRPQRYYCTLCKRAFYAHTSQTVTKLDPTFKDVLTEYLQNGRISIKILAARLQITKSHAFQIIADLMKRIDEKVEEKQSFLEKCRNSNTLVVDETFLRIHHKTWYLTVVITGDKEIMGYHLGKDRKEETLKPLLDECAARLNRDFELLITDGLPAYKGIAKHWVLEHHLHLIHVRHIHQPDFHQIYLDYYEPLLSGYQCYSTIFRNDILVQGGAFILPIKMKREDYPTGQRGRKPGGKNRSKEEIALEKQAKLAHAKPRGRPKGKRNPLAGSEPHVFIFHKEAGYVEPIWESSPSMGVALNLLQAQFAGKYITSNLIEQEFSALKELLCFRGRRSAERWDLLLKCYYELRDNPQLLEEIFSDFEYPASTLLKVQNSLISLTISITGGSVME